MLMDLLPPSLLKTYFITGNQKTPLKQLQSFDEFLKIYINILKATEFLHKVDKIIHGDLHADNICIDSNGKIYLCDFEFTTKIEETKEEIPEKTDIIDLGYLLDSCYKKTPAIQPQLDLLSPIYKKMVENYCSIQEAIKYFVDLYNTRNPSDQLSYDWYEHDPIVVKPEIDFTEPNKQDAILLVKIWLAEEKIQNTPRKYALERLKLEIQSAGSVIEIDELIHNFKDLEKTIQKIQQNNIKVSVAEAYSTYAKNPKKIRDSIENLKQEESEIQSRKQAFR